MSGALERPPLRLVLPAVLAAVFLVLPLVALLLRTPWARLPGELLDPQVRSALWLSLGTATVATAFCTIFGLPLAWLLARVAFPGRSVLRALVTVPLVLPPVVAGVALISTLGRRGLIGAELAAFDIRIPFTTAAVVIAHTFVAMPFFVLSVEGALRGTPTDYETAAATLGATRWRTFVRVTVPLAFPGITAGMALAWARSLGEFGATITFAGNYEGTTRTMPNAVYGALQADQDQAVVLSVVMLAFCVGVLLLLRERWLGVR